MLVADIAARAGVSYSTALNRMNTQEGDDLELEPGLFQSAGGISHRFDGEAITTIAVRLFNESRFDICVRANATLIGGPMAGSRQGGSLGYTFLIEPGRNESVIANSAPRLYNLNNAMTYAITYVFWLAAPAGTERRCSSGEPAGLDEHMKSALPDIPGVSHISSPELSAALAR